MEKRIISKQTTRRYVLGRQGLWPGRRFRGKEGTAAAIKQSEAIQIDTISVIARSHDIALWSRVEDYQPEYLASLHFTDRQFLDYGSILMVYPMEEFAHWRTIMAHWQARLGARLQTEVAEHVRQELRARGPLGSRDFAERQRIPGGYRTIKDTGAAIYHLWLSGELMTHSRRSFERIYDFAANVTPQSHWVQQVTVEEATAYFTAKAMRDCGLATASEWARRVSVILHRRPNPKEARETLNSLVADGILTQVCVEGTTEARYVSTEDLPLMETLEAGNIPVQWQPLGKTTEEAVTFLAPLDNVLWDRARAKALFDFEYLWEVYKPAEQRRWGYYTLPILYGDSLAARMAFRLDRKTSTLHIEGYWPEDEKRCGSAAFYSALKLGLERFAQFHQAQTIQPELSLLK